MRIAMVGPFAFRPKGTVPLRIMPIAQRLAQAGHRVSIFLPPYDNPQESGKRTTVDDIPVNNIRLGPEWPLAGHLLTSERLLRAALAFKPDLVHIFKPRGPSGVVAGLLIALKRLGRKVALVLDTDDWEGRGGFYDYWRDHRLYPWYLLKLADIQDRWIPPRVDSVTVASRTLEARIWSLGIPRERVFYLPNGPHRFPEGDPLNNRDSVRRRLGLEDRSVVLLYTRFFEFSPHSAIETVANICGAEDNARLLVVGTGLYGEEKEFLELADKRGLQGHMVNIGWVEPNLLQGYLAAADVAIYPLDDTLLNRSKSPGKLVELMSLGIPVVASRVGQAAECIEHGTSGLLVDPGDDQGMANAVLELIRKPDLRTQTGKNAHERIWTKFNWDDQIRTVWKAYEVALNLADSKPGRSDTPTSGNS